ncbi:MAG: general secretion pathway protein GspK [Oligoflexia bacterium]|nr:general secretion pathway protein GspK [Oligoflexia bacterium]
MRNQRGIAMLVALSAVLIMTFLAVEVGYNTSVELAVGVSQMDRLKAYYLARAGVKISLLRIKIYKTIIKRFGNLTGQQKSMVEMIWSFPLVWPPNAASSMGLVDKQEFDKAVKNSLMDGSFMTTIEPEGNKIDVTDLISPSKILKESSYNQLVAIIKNKIDEDDDWADLNRNLKPEEVVNNITDWMDEDTQSLNGGDENSYYFNIDQKLKPTNRPFKTLNELHMVAGVTDEVFNHLLPRITLYGIKGINVNTASKEVIRSIDKQIDDKVADEIIQRRTDPDQGPFTSIDDFTNFLRNKINIENFNKNPPIPLYFESEFNFRIKSRGFYKKAQREIFAIIYDFDKVKEQLVAVLPTPSPSPSPTQGNATNPNQQPSPSPSPSPKPSSLPSGPPQIVFWQEY